MTSPSFLRLLPLPALLLSATTIGAGTPTEDIPSISDNSFLIEEAYNQEQGIVQNISSLARERDTGRWTYSFTQEWPAPTCRHQVSWTLFFVDPGGRAGGGLGDAGVNYRYMVAGAEGGPVAFAPRVSVFLPSGSSDEGRGEGGPDVQLNLPLSLEAGNRLVLHTNLGLLHVWNARNEDGTRADLDAVWAGQSIIWLLRPSFNLMLEALWQRSEIVEDGVIDHRSSFVLSPGVRFAINRPSGLQIVPGIAFPMEPHDGESGGALLLYLSFEHPFGPPSRTVPAALRNPEP